MVRRIASQVHKQASRLTRAGFLKAPPLWYHAVLDNPPLPLPPREPPSRTSYDYDDATKKAPGTATAKKTKKTPGPRSLAITYVEDGIRRQFFRDHPFEAFRARCITEAGTIEDEHPVSGLDWTRLNQRGRNPSPEDAVRFALNLHQSHGLALSDAYATSIAQFRALRAVQHVAIRFAAQAASACGARFGPSATASGFEAEGRVLEADERRSERLDDSARLARRRWRMIARGRGGDGGGDAGGDEANRDAWSRGEEYVRLWREGVRVDYSPASIEPIEAVDPVDFMGTRGRHIPR
ncbi:mitochondrial ribosomal protein S25-domain-containing protein [Russula dissimulans]|nr:mitochondrial ribosomal protein S25-domain-containing protein [Russula dissimulans]